MLMFATRLALGTVGLQREVARSEQALLLGGHRHEQHRALRPGRGHHLGRLDQRGDARGVVHRAVVDVVAVDRRADADVIEVRGEHDVLVGQLGIAALHHADDVLRLDRLRLDRHRRLHRGRQREMRQRLALVGDLQHLGQRVPRALEQPLGLRRVERDRHLLRRRCRRCSNRPAPSTGSAGWAPSAPTARPCSSGWGW